MTAKNIIEKIWNAHIVHQQEGHPVILAVDFMLIHEVTSAQAFSAIDEKSIKAFDPRRLLATIDHSVPTRFNREEIFDPAAKNQVETMRRNAKNHNIPLCDYDKGQGVVHVVGPERGLTQPGMVIVCGDSHTATHGAFGALAFGVGTSEVANVLATGCLLQKKPKTMRVEFRGHLSKGVFSKDVILKLISQIGVGGATGYVIEYCGDAIQQMSMEARMTLCNMSIECGARAGLIAPDETTFAYLKGCAYAPKGSKWEDAVSYWKQWISDKGCSYDAQVTVDVGSLKPMVTWGITPAQAVFVDQLVPDIDKMSNGEKAGAKVALDYIGLKSNQPLSEVDIDWAFVGSCTNGRIEDLRIAAEVVKGRKVHPRVKMYVVPGSEAVRAQAINEGLDKIFTDAGAEFRMPGCSMCLAMNDDKVPAGERCISTSNRNFMGRQGTGSRTHLASPATVAASAIAGKISSPLNYF